MWTSSSSFATYEETFETFQKSEARKMKLQETIAYCSVFSPDGEYLLCGSSFGDIALWRLKDYLNEAYWSNPSSGTPPPLRTWHAHSYGPVYSLSFCKKFLVSGGDEYMRVWDWEKILENMRSGSFEYSCQLQNPVEAGGLTAFKQLSETNAISSDPKTGLIYTAAGDNNAYCWDLERKTCLVTFQGHCDYLHCIKYIQTTGLLATGSEDGTVRLWDTRTSKCTTILDCTKGAVVPQYSIERSHYFSPNWITCLDTDEGGNWLVCGGGHNMLSMWYLAIPSITCYMPTQGTPHAVVFSEGKIISAGNDQHLSHWQLDGKLKVRVPTTAKTIFSLSLNHNNANRIMVGCGSSPFIDVFTEMTYKGFAFSLAPSE